ncbi:MAG: O-antigen ligase family protein, partial [Gaiellaceae bacterium]
MPAGRSGVPAFLLASLAVFGLAADGGGYDATSWGWATIALAWVAAASLVFGSDRRLSRLELVALAALGALVVLAALSTLWSSSLPLSVLDAQRLLVPFAGLAAFLLVGGRGAMLGGVAAAATAVSLWNLVTRHGAGPESGADAQPLGYGNGVAILAGVGLLLALGLARELPAYRLVGLAAAIPLAAVFVLPDSRAALIAVAAGAAATVALRSRRARIAFPAALAMAAAVLVVAAITGSAERPAYWRVALEEAAGEPVLGSGAGTWVRAWLERRDEAFPARDAHGLYLETLSELGPLGLALVLTALGVPLVAAYRARREPLVPVAAGAYAAFVLHAGVDWDLELTSVALAGIACGAVLLGAAGRERIRLPRAPALVTLGAVALAGAASLAGNAYVESAARALRAGDASAAEPRAERATQLAPWSAEAWRLRG